MKLRLGTRGSELALTQSGTIAQRLNDSGVETELTIIRTAGDRSSTASFASIGPQGVFVREIEQALLESEIDLAVHSFKDLPTASPAELVIAAVPEREDPADILIVRDEALTPEQHDWLPLREHARVGTASARRRVWLEHFRADLEIDSLRGNVPTRIKRLREGQYDAIVLAASGVERLRAAGDTLEEVLQGLNVVRLDPERFVPAPAQGAVAVQCRRNDMPILTALSVLDHAPSRTVVEAERDTLARAEGGCETAFGAYCRPEQDGFELIAMLERDGELLSTRVRSRLAGSLAASAWDELVGDG